MELAGLEPATSWVRLLIGQFAWELLRFVERNWVSAGVPASLGWMVGKS
jgi:hypothetical protein